MDIKLKNIPNGFSPNIRDYDFGDVLILETLCGDVVERFVGIYTGMCNDNDYILDIESGLLFSDIENYKVVKKIYCTLTEN